MAAAQATEVRGLAALSGWVIQSASRRAFQSRPNWSGTAPRAAIWAGSGGGWIEDVKTWAMSSSLIRQAMAMRVARHEVKGQGIEGETPDGVAVQKIQQIDGIGGIGRVVPCLVLRASLVVAKRGQPAARLAPTVGAKVAATDF